jgi:hypothetical protein
MNTAQKQLLQHLNRFLTKWSMLLAMKLDHFLKAQPSGSNLSFSVAWLSVRGVN